jgi:hypothetical protein
MMERRSVCATRQVPTAAYVNQLAASVSVNPTLWVDVAISACLALTALDQKDAFVS